VINIGNTISQISKFRHVLVTQKYSIDILHTYTKGCSNVFKCFGLVSYDWLQAHTNYMLSQNYLTTSQFPNMHLTYPARVKFWNA
jgi:hypothetical protein